MTHPERMRLPHEIPSWVPDGSLHFITVCGAPRGQDQFCREPIARKILDAVQNYHERLLWHVRVFLLMPDHVHGVMAFGRDRSIKQIIASWKGFLAKTCGIAWQRDFFEHRLRNDENEVAKVHYVRMNPVRAGLVARPEDWPYVWPR